MAEISSITPVIDQLFSVIKTLISEILTLRTSDLITLVIIVAFIVFFIHLIKIKLDIIEHNLIKSNKK